MEKRANKYAGECARCHEPVAAGNGYITQWYDDAEDRKVWLVWHNDETTCQANIARQEQERHTMLAKHQDREAEQRALIAKVSSETGLAERQDWSWDDYRFSLGNELARTEHFVARQYLTDGQVIGFSIKDAD